MPRPSPTRSRGAARCCWCSARPPRRRPSCWARSSARSGLGARWGGRLRRAQCATPAALRRSSRSAPLPGRCWRRALVVAAARALRRHRDGRAGLRAAAAAHAVAADRHRSGRVPARRHAAGDGAALGAARRRDRTPDGLALRREHGRRRRGLPADRLRRRGCVRRARRASGSRPASAPRRPGRPPGGLAAAAGGAPEGVADATGRLRGGRPNAASTLRAGRARGALLRLRRPGRRGRGLPRARVLPRGLHRHVRGDAGRVHRGPRDRQPRPRTRARAHPSARRACWACCCCCRSAPLLVELFLVVPSLEGWMHAIRERAYAGARASGRHRGRPARRPRCWARRCCSSSRPCSWGPRSRCASAGRSWPATRPARPSAASTSGTASAACSLPCS